MPDITCCKGDNCPIHLKENCYRYRATWNNYQSVVDTFIIDGNEECKYYWESK